MHLRGQDLPPRVKSVHAQKKENHARGIPVEENDAIKVEKNLGMTHAQNMNAQYPGDTLTLRVKLCGVINAATIELYRATPFADMKDVLWKRLINWTALELRTALRSNVQMVTDILRCLPEP